MKDSRVWADEKVAVEHGRSGGGGSGGGGGAGGFIFFIILVVLGGIYVSAEKKDREHNAQQRHEPAATSTPGEKPSASSPMTCTQRIGHACNGDFCGPPFRCDPDGVVRQIPEGGQCGSNTPGCTDCGFGGALRCGVYTWSVGECHCVD